MQLDTTVNNDMNMNADVMEQPIQESSSQGWFSWLSDKFQESLASKEVIVETLIYFGAGCAFGFLAKRYLKHVIIALILLVVLIKGMEWANIGMTTINWDRVKELTGLSPSDSVSSVSSIFIAWVQSHIRQSIAVVVGVLVGAKLG